MTIGPPMPSFGTGLRIIRAYVLSDCEGNPWLWAEHALPVAGRIALAYLTFDVRSFVKRLIRVPGARQNRHSRRGNRSGRPGPRRRGPGGIPELADMAADIIDPEKDLRPPTYSTPTQTMWLLDDVVERYAYTLMLFESIDGLVWEPFAAILQSDKRLCPDIPRLFSTAGFSPEGPPWAARSMAVNEVNIGWSQSTGPTTTPLLGPAIFIFAGRARNTSNSSNGIGARLLVGGQPAATTLVDIAAGASADFIVQVDLKQGQTVAPQTRSYTSYAAVDSYDCTFFGFGMPV